MTAVRFDPAIEDLAALDAKTLLVSASAGTGKTWMITDLASRWLLEADGRSPESILLVTFSRAAAGELKSRLRTRLLEIRAVLEGHAGDDELPPWLAALASHEAERAVALRRLRHVLPLLEGVNARTIHSFAAAVRATGDETRSGEAIYARAANEAITKAALEAPETLLDLQEALPGRTTLATVLIELATKSSALGGWKTDGPTRAFLGSIESDEAGRAQYLVSLVDDVVRRANQIQSLDHVTTFDALIAGLFHEIAAAREAGSASALVESLRTSFELVLIDEFQDTDQAQWEIFSDVFMGHVPVVIVGDPKQAIYRFRGGDVVIFQELLDQAALDPGRFFVHHLSVNRRSSATLVGHLNGLFGAADALRAEYAKVEVPVAKKKEKGSEDGDGFEWKEIPRTWGFSEGSDQPGLQPIEYEFVDAKRTDETPGLTVRDLRTIERADRADLLERRRYPAFEKVPTDDRLVADDLASYLARRLDGDDDPETFLRNAAVLVRTSSQALMVRSALRRAGIPSVLSSTESVFRSQAAQELLVLLWAMSDATNPRRSGLLVYTWFADHADQVRSLAEAMTRFGPGALARRALTTATMARVLAGDDGERSWTDLEHLVELLAKAFPRSVTPNVAHRWLEAQLNRPEEDEGQDRADARRIESDRAALRIMTVHKSKGLEFKVVLLPFLEIGGQGIARSVYALSEPDGRRFELGPLVGGDAAVERRDALQESDEGARKLYVALTRGRDEVVAWVSNRAQLHADDGTANAVFVSSLWLQLVEPIGFLENDEVARMADAAGGVPFGRPSIEHVVRERGGRRTETARDVPAISTKDVTARPQIDESLRRRWSYSYLGVAGVDVARPDPADVDDDPGFDAGSLAESELDPELLETTRDGSLFGGFAGAAVGNALHAVLEALVGEVASGDLRTKRDLVLKAFASEGLVLDDPDPVCDQLAVVLSRHLGPMMDHRSLDSFVTPDATKRLAKEMNFTVALHASGAPHDLVGEIAELALEHDAEGPYRAYFEGLRREHATSARLFQGFLNGSIDLVAQVDDTPRFVVVDYKSNVAAKGHGYSPDELVAKMAGAGYPLQALLYSVALHRYLDQRLDDYDAEANLGGALYLFLRGMVTAPQGSDQGLAAWKLPARLVVATSELLGEGATHDA